MAAPVYKGGWKTVDLVRMHEKHVRENISAQVGASPSEHSCDCFCLLY